MAARLGPPMTDDAAEVRRPSSFPPGAHHRMSDVAEFLTFWGKARPSGEGTIPSHPVAYHLLDVAATAQAILHARPIAAARIAGLLGLPVPEASRLIVVLAALHDVGKFARAFQAKAPACWPESALGPYREAYEVRQSHTEDGLALWNDRIGPQLADRVWIGSEDALRILAPAVFGHHGRPVSAGAARDPVRVRFRDGLAAAEGCADAVVALLSPNPLTSPVPDEACVRLASWAISGLLTVADWIGSSERWFPYATPEPTDDALHGYWARARAQAERAVREAGLVPSRSAAERSFAEIAQRPDAPTPVQRWAAAVPLPEGPALFVIEDVTGSGKTEAAQMLVHRLMAGARATGAYWAMPTMATANAMYARQAAALGALYVSEAGRPAPSLVLAHGQQRLHEGFRATVLDGANESPERRRYGDGELTSSVACAAFLADDRRAALLADVGAGTIDQAILGALPSRFNTIRLFGLADKVLVVDEAHAYDRYMGVEIMELLRFHAALGGSALILSATLPRDRRRELAQAWLDGVAGGGRASTFGERIALASEAYPLATVVAPAGIAEQPLDAAPWSHRSVGARLVHDTDGALAHVLDAQRRGAAVAWVRNTVDDCLTAAARLREQGIEPLVFHARFAQGDRQAREAEVMRRFGAHGDADARRGSVLVATQVIEQSLDLDFDAMVSDVAPIDLLVQRAGRLWRHKHRTDAGRPDGLTMELVMLAPEPLEEPPADWLGGPFAGTAHVYANAGVVWRTVRALARTGRIATPAGLRALIEEVYDCEGHVPLALLPVTERSEGKQSAHAMAANHGVLKAPDGYHADAVGWVSDMRMPTRLGDARTTVRLARVTEGDLLEPWVTVEGPAWKSWALSEVSVSAYRVPPGSTTDPRFADAVTRLRSGWGRFEQETPVLPLASSAAGAWTGELIAPEGKRRQFGYDATFGLVFGLFGEGQAP